MIGALRPELERLVEHYTRKADGKRLWTDSEVAAMLAMSPTTLRHVRNAGKVQPPIVTPRRWAYQECAEAESLLRVDLPIRSSAEPAVEAEAEHDRLMATGR